MIVIIGLGNPGERYAKTRHNVGATVVKAWCKKLGLRLQGRRFQSRHVITVFEKKALMLFCPVTYMNNSGLAVEACVESLEVEPKKMLVVHDDLDLPVGRLKMVRGGGSGGHKGVQSIIQHLGTDAFPRLKVGIGRPRFGESVEDFVLSAFYEGEVGVMEKVIDAAVRACEWFVSMGVEAAMNRTNCQNLAEKEVAD